MSGDGISGGTAFMMIAVALVIDGIQAILTFLLIGFIVNPLISCFLVAPLFAGWFLLHKVSVLSLKNVGPFFGTLFAENVLGVFPFWTGFVILTCIRSKAKAAIATQQTRYVGPWR